MGEHIIGYGSQEDEGQAEKAACSPLNLSMYGKEGENERPRLDMWIQSENSHSLHWPRR